MLAPYSLERQLTRPGSHPHELLPLRQMVTATGDAAPVFARQGLLDWLSRPERYQVISHGSGAQVLAAGERALAEAQGILRQAYGARVSFGMPTVHSFVDTLTETLMVPVIFVRIDAPRVHAPSLRQLLAQRSADLKELAMQRDRVVLRAEILLSRSLGIEAEVRDATGDAAHVLSWLLRYERATADAQRPPPSSSSRLVASGS